MIIRKHAYPRAGLIGNPSDGYFGRTISFAFTNFRAEVILYETPELEILPNTRDHSRFDSIGGLVKDVKMFGYYGGIRLLKAALKKFFDYCTERRIRLHNRNFTIRYNSDIPHLVGLAGSSAIITACIRALMEFYNVNIPKPILPNIILSVEKDELGISAGLQDRVIQVYQGLVYMDFDRRYMEEHGHGKYEEIDHNLLPPLYIAYRADLSEGSEIVHNDLRYRFEKNDPEVISAISFWADLAKRVRDALLVGKKDEIPPLLNANFDRRREICKISDGNLRMVMTARKAGASAKFTGSGGAIVGTYNDEEQFEKLCAELDKIGVKTFRPVVAQPIKD